MSGVFESCFYLKFILILFYVINSMYYCKFIVWKVSRVSKFCFYVNFMVILIGLRLKPGCP